MKTVQALKILSNHVLNVGILKTDEGRFEDGHWKIIRYLNGVNTGSPEIHAGRSK